MIRLKKVVRGLDWRVQVDVLTDSLRCNRDHVLTGGVPRVKGEYHIDVIALDAYSNILQARVAARSRPDCCQFRKRCKYPSRELSGFMQRTERKSRGARHSFVHDESRTPADRSNQLRSAAVRGNQRSFCRG